MTALSDDARRRGLRTKSLKQNSTPTTPNAGIPRLARDRARCISAFQRGEQAKLFRVCPLNCQIRCFVSSRRYYRRYLPRYFPLPHPSWRTQAWERANPWFTSEVLPALRAEVAAALK